MFLFEWVNFMLILLKASLEDERFHTRRVIDTSILDIVEYDASVINSYRSSDSAPRIMGLNCGDVSVTDGYSMKDAVVLQLLKYKLMGHQFSVFTCAVGLGLRSVDKDDKGLNFKGTTFDIPYGVALVYDNYFLRNSALLSHVRVAPTVVSIGRNAFNNCSSLTLVEFTGSSSLKEIKEGAFVNCSSLSEISLPERLTTLYPMAFRKCVKLSKISFGGIHSNLSEICQSCFRFCGSLKEIAFTSKMKTVSNWVFDGTRVNVFDLRQCDALVDACKSSWKRQLFTSSSNTRRLRSLLFREDEDFTIIVRPDMFTKEEITYFSRLENLYIEVKD